MKKILLTVTVSVLLVFIKTEAAKAQLDTLETSTVNVTIGTVTELSADNGNLETFAFTTGSELLTGITQTNAVSLAYKSNKVTTINIKALGAGFFSGGNDDMPVGVISYKKNSAATFVPLTIDDVALSALQAKGSSGFGIDYKITPGLTYDPATDYAVTIQYTLTAQ